MGRRVGEITVARQFNGPPDSGNGGYCAGMAARFIGGPASVTLRAPPPLDAPLDVFETDGGIEVRAGETLIMSAAPASPSSAVPAPPSLEEAAAASKAYPGPDRHALPTCFVCGPARSPGDGLCIHAAPLADRPEVLAAPWTPHERFAGPDGLIREEILWAAIDCPSAFAVPAKSFFLLGRLTGEVRRRPRPGEPLIALGWAAGSEGRKHGAASAIVSPDGEILAQSDELWIELKT